MVGFSDETAVVEAGGVSHPFRGWREVSAVLRSVHPTYGAAARALTSAVSAECGTAACVLERTGDGAWQVIGRFGAPSGEIVAAVDGVAVAVPDRHAVSPAGCARLSQACVWLALHRERTSSRDRLGELGKEISVLRAVTDELLSLRDLDQVLLSITDHTLRLLDSDICGVFPRDGEELRMRSCIGNRVVDTARLRMREGQGVAGRVFQTGEPAKVDEYLVDETISDDFMPLAQQEHCQSALAVPLHLPGALIGVLEVWRRRSSVFTDDDVGRLVSLADFATIAIRNARLYDEQASALAALQETRDALEGQVEILRRSAELQRALLTAVLDGSGLAAIARVVAREVDCQVAVYSPDGQRVPECSGSVGCDELPQRLCHASRAGRTELELTDGRKAAAWVHPVVAEHDQVGAVCLLGCGQTEQVLEMASGQAAMACSLAHLQQRAASKARAEALEQILWDLLQGPPEHRVAARSRAQQMGIALIGAHRVLCGHLNSVEQPGSQSDTTEGERLRRNVQRGMRTCTAMPRTTLLSVRGDSVAVLTPMAQGEAARELAGQLSSAIAAVAGELSVTWGISRAHDDPAALPAAFDEAQTALSAAHRLGGQSVFVYEELGILRLLLGSGNDPDLRAFLQEVTGPLLDYDREHGGALLRTLRAFFDANCSQKLAAERLYIHHKTLRYRLEQIKQLTGLDLARHDDRMRADFALRLLQVTDSASGDGPSRVS
jgi:sugar diacid utilization regulator/putative methionine-R-sulfoxide reductase with GAF domain